MKIDNIQQQDRRNSGTQKIFQCKSQEVNSKKYFEFFTQVKSKQDDQELQLTKVFVFSQVIVIIGCLLIYSIIYVTGDYISYFILATISSIAIRPLQKYFTDLILQLFMKKTNQGYKYFSNYSIIFRIIRLVIDFKMKALLKQFHKLQLKKLTNDVYYLIYIAILYVLAFKIDKQILLIVVGMLIVLDLIIRFLMDLLFILINKFRNKKYQKKYEIIHLDENQVKKFITPLMILQFFLIAIMSSLFVIIMLIQDIQQLIISLQLIYSALFEKINVSQVINKDMISQQMILQFQDKVKGILSSYLLTNDVNSSMKMIEYISQNIFGEINQEAYNSTLTDIDFNQQIYFLLIMRTSQANSFVHLYYEQCSSQYQSYVSNAFFQNIALMYCKIQAYGSQFQFNVNEIVLIIINNMNSGIIVFFKIVFQHFLLEIIFASKTALDFLFNLLIYILCLYYLLSAQTDVLTNMASILPVKQRGKDYLKVCIQKQVYGVFASSFKISLYHVIFTWLLLNVIDIEFSFIMAGLAGICSLIPLFSPSILIVPISIYIYIVDGSILKSVGIIILYTFVSGKVFNDIYKESIDVHPYVTGLSIFLGFLTFDLKGIIYGPLLVCIAVILYDYIKNTQTNFNQNDIFQQQEEASSNENSDQIKKPRLSSFS